MYLKVQKNLEVPSNPKVNCLAWNKKNGYLAYIDCEKTVKAMKLQPTWQVKYPSPEFFCRGEDKDKDPRCVVSAPGFSHPHVIMVDDNFYTLQIETP